MKYLGNGKSLGSGQWLVEDVWRGGQTWELKGFFTLALWDILGGDRRSWCSQAGLWGWQHLPFRVCRSLLEHHLLCVGEIHVFAVAISWCSWLYNVPYEVTYILGSTYLLPHLRPMSLLLIRVFGYEKCTFNKLLIACSGLNSSLIFVSCRINY